MSENEEEEISQQEGTGDYEVEEIPFGLEPQSPGFGLQSPEFEPQSPRFEPESPGFESRSPGFVPPSPEFAPRSPESDSQSPEFEPQSPRYEPQSPEYEPKSPGYEPRSPGYEPRSPGYESQSSRYESQSPGYERQNPGFEPQNPEFKTQSPEFEAQSSKFQEGAEILLNPEEKNPLSIPLGVHPLDSFTQGFGEQPTGGLPLGPPFEMPTGALLATPQFEMLQNPLGLTGTLRGPGRRGGRARGGQGPRPNICGICGKSFGRGSIKPGFKFQLCHVPTVESGVIKLMSLSFGFFLPCKIGI